MLKPLKTTAAGIALGLVVAGLGFIGVGADAAYGKTVTVSVDGVTAEVRLLHASVAEVLIAQGIALGPHDEVEPALAEAVGDDTVISVRHARPIALSIDGRAGTYWTFATSVAAVLAELGLEDAAVDPSSGGLEALVPRSGLALSLDTGQDVTVIADGASLALHATGTVADALATAGLDWDVDDLVSPAPSQRLAPGAAISLVRVDAQTVTRETAIPFETVSHDDPSLALGRTETDSPGEAGLILETVVQTYHDGVLVGEETVASQLVKEPVARVERKGSKPVDVAPGSAQEAALEQVLARGWDGEQFGCLVKLWNRESGWRVNASNPSSGAYGIPQALPGSKMASAGADWQTNPAT
ncbi:MAG: ubiquitin-like domain-containing protein, partial [Propionibacteriaceae bacterium]|nr:ubiquitin-like domain-containing protein [Propionibacteriaceae bacterium]